MGREQRLKKTTRKKRKVLVDHAKERDRDETRVRKGL